MFNIFFAQGGPVKDQIIQKLTQFGSWLAQSKNWQLRSVVATAVAPFLALAYFFHPGNLVATAIVSAVVVILAPQIRTKLVAVNKQSQLSGLITLVMSLIFTAFLSPLFQFWLVSVNIGPLLFLQSIVILFRPQKNPAQTTTKPIKKVKSKPNKRDRRKTYR